MYNKSMPPHEFQNEAKNPRSERTDMSTCLGAIRMLCDVTGLCNEPASVPDIGERVLRRVCECQGWFTGRIHLFDPAGQVRRVAIEQPNTIASGDHSRLLDELDVALLSEVKRTGEPVWQRTEFATDGKQAVTGMCAPIRRNDTVLGAIVLLSESRPPPAEEIRSAVETVATLLAGVIERQKLDRTIAEVASEEQYRIGQDLHDSVSQDLSGAALIGDGVARRLEANGNFNADAVRRINSSIRNALATIRGITEGLIPLQFDDANLNAAIQRMADVMDRQSQTTISIEGHAPDLPAAVSRELFLITNEAVRNAMTHACASAIEIKWSAEDTDTGKEITIQIRDNGRGLDPETGYEAGRGIVIMRHRASMIDGRLEFESSERGGTIVRCRVPVPLQSVGRVDEERTP